MPLVQPSSPPHTLTQACFTVLSLFLVDCALSRSLALSLSLSVILCLSSLCCTETVGRWTNVSNGEMSYSYIVIVYLICGIVATEGNH